MAPYACCALIQSSTTVSSTSSGTAIVPGQW
jgi:hypothetical protein